ncbi:MAG: epoxyqueuosine reductase QueH, partial [Helicobacter sp.]|nr:epoxyqueuosine reductase QueH [Helicobacter sp.]
MSKISYDFNNENTTLVHICCSVDSHHFLTQLQQKYPTKRFCGYFYNPNIHPYEEYLMRLKDVQRSCQMLGIPLIEGEYDLPEWLEGSKGLEDEPEKGERCIYCFDYRLEKSAKVAKQTHCVEFTTTLLASPLKSKDELFARGESIAKKHHIAFLPIDVRSNGGTQIQNQLSKEANLYRQNYCGCLFALKKQREHSNKIPIELISSLNLPRNSRNLPSLRIKIFQTRDQLEQANKKYQSIKRKILHYQLMKGLLMQEKQSIPSFICIHSSLQKTIKAKVEFWNAGIGYANKEGIMLLDFEYFKQDLEKSTFKELLEEGLSEGKQNRLRYKLYPTGFLTSPVIIIEKPI